MLRWFVTSDLVRVCKEMVCAHFETGPLSGNLAEGLQNIIHDDHSAGHVLTQKKKQDC